jgi:hypothetical protein
MTSIIDLIVIVYIIILSYIFCSGNDNIKNSINKYSCLLSHIVIGLSVIVFYKLARYFKLNDKLSNKLINNTEQFDDSVTDSINNFIQNSGTTVLTPSQAATLTPAQLTDYSSKLDKIISSLNDLQNKQNNPDPLSGTSTSNLNSLDLNAQQQAQMFQLEYLNKQIKNSQDIINAQTIADSNINYKPIKVFSSCIVSNANGSTTLETPVSNNYNANNSNTISSIGNLSPNTQQMLNTISQTSAQPSSQPNDIQLSQQSGIFQSLLSNLSSLNNAKIY